MNTEYMDKEWLKERYYQDGLSMAAIGKLCGVSPETVFYWMRTKFKLRLRTRTRAMEARLKREREAAALQVLQSADCLGDVILRYFEDEALFKGCPELLEQVRRREARQAKALVDAEHRRGQARRLESTRDTSSVDYSPEEQMAILQAQFDKPSKRR